MSHIHVFHEFQDLRTPICSGFCACSYVKALLRLVVILGTALRRFTHNDDDVDSRAKAKNEMRNDCFVIHICEQIPECCTHTYQCHSIYTHTQAEQKKSLVLITVTDRRSVLKHQHNF